jgi:methionine-rich copper-binding protein CopC
MPITGRLTRVIATASAILALGVLGAGPASAHSQLTSTSPVDGAVLDAPPTEIRLTFDSTLLDDTDTISINDENGNVVSSIHPKPEGDSVAIPWPAGTPAGTYQVAYRVVCGDGHPVVGAMNVTLTAAAANTASAVSAASMAPAPAPAPAPPSPAAAATNPAAPAPGIPLPLVASVLALAAAAAATVAVVVTRRRNAHS